MEEHSIFVSYNNQLQSLLPSPDYQNYHQLQDKKYTSSQRQRQHVNIQNSQSLAPTYEEVIKTIAAIRNRFPKRSIQAIIQQVLTKIIPQASNQVTNQTDFTHFSPYISANQDGYSQSELRNIQKKIVGTVFMEVGFGFSYLQRYIQNKTINLAIHIDSYNNIINELLYNAYKKLQEIIDLNCHSYNFELMKIETTADFNYLFDVMRNCRENLELQQVSTLSKLIKANFESNCQIQVSKASACKLYQTLYEHIKKLKQNNSNQKVNYNADNNFQQKIQIKQLSQKDIWTDIMTVSLINLYVQDPISLPKIRYSLKEEFNTSNALLSNQNLKYQLQAIFRQSIERIQLQMESHQCLEMGTRFKRLVKLDDKRFNLILSSPDAVNVRTALCEFYLIETFDLNTLVCTILCINEFINIKEHQEISKNLKVTKQQNSICRQEYEFAGKRRKVLVFKRKKKPREKPKFF